MLELRQECANQIEDLKIKLDKQTVAQQLEKQYRTLNAPHTTGLKISPQISQPSVIAQPGGISIDKLRLHQIVKKNVIIKKPKAVAKGPDFSEIDTQLAELLNEKKLLSNKILPW